MPYSNTLAAVITSALNAFHAGAVTPAKVGIYPQKNGHKYIWRFSNFERQHLIQWSLFTYTGLFCGVFT